MLKKGIISYFPFPTACILCGQLHREKLCLCALCQSRLSFMGAHCQYCAWPLDDTSFPICGNCLKEPPPIHEMTAVFCFEEPFRLLLHAFKYNETIALNRFFANALFHAVKDKAMPECLIPVPISNNRLGIRGFNQAALLAKAVARRLAIACDLNLCKKIKHTRPQAGLTAKQRQHNLKNAFSCRLTTYQHVAIVDDLVTTGATTFELAMLLKKHGVTRVDVWCLARVKDSITSI